jgi:hypothetical protein
MPQMNKMTKLVTWMRRLDFIATAVDSWKENSVAPFSNATALALLERQIGWNMVEVT